jgi:predicted DNA-binding protein (MmcQ/YjbR family)
MAKTDAILTRMREICLSLPDTKETMTWGKPHFRVGDKIFAGCGEENGRQVIGFKLQMAHAEAVIKDPRFWRAPYVGHKGWVSMDAAGVKDWDELRAMILESFRLIAQRKTLAKLAGAVAAGAKKETREFRATRTGSTAKTRRR